MNSMKPTRTWYNRFTRGIALILCVAALLSLTACGSASAMEQKQIFAMDTVMTLTAYGKHAQDGLAAATSVINSMEALLASDQHHLRHQSRKRAERCRQRADRQDAQHRQNGL